MTFDFCPMKFMSTLPGNYEIVQHRFEVFGICPDCSNAAKSVKQAEAVAVE